MTSHIQNVTQCLNIWQVEDQSMTRHIFPTLFSGAELVVAGRLKEHVLPDSLLGHVSGSSLKGSSLFSSSGVAKASSLERSWAYLTIQQLLEEHELEGEDDTNPTKGKDSKKKALELALKVSLCFHMWGFLKSLSYSNIYWLWWDRKTNKLWQNKSLILACHGCELHL